MNRRSVLLAGVAAVAAAGGWWLTGNKTGGLPDLGVGAANAQQASDIDTAGVVEMVLGADDAPVTLIEYASFTCPHCANFHKAVMAPLKLEYIDTGKVKFIYRDVYFDRFGLWASMVARCDPMRFFGISDMLFDQQKEWVAGGDPVKISENLRKIGKVAGLDDSKLEACLADGDTAQTLVAWYQKNGEADQIDSTPTLIIDGEKHSNMSFADLKVILDKKLGE